MCRILGIVYGPGGPGAEDLRPDEIAKVMFPALVKKGPHAYGWMANVDDDVYYNKHVGRSDTREADENLSAIPDNCKWFVGHTRWATHGSPEDNRNNHPLQHGNILGVHNGVLHNHEEILDVTGREDPKTEVDSEAIFSAISYYGHRAGLRKIVGDMVTVYTNLEKPRTVHIARSAGRPLVYAYTRAGSFIFASEDQAIHATGLPLSSRANVLPSNTLLRVREGKVRERITFRKPVQRADLDANWNRTRERILRRSTATSLSPPGRSLESPYLRRQYEERKRRESEERWGGYDNTVGLYYYRGQYMSEAEYISQVMDDLEMPMH